jgi:hypothetical protein
VHVHDQSPELPWHARSAYLDAGSAGSACPACHRLRRCKTRGQRLILTLCPALVSVGPGLHLRDAPSGRVGLGLHALRLGRRQRW